jgi:hypothetical protein
MWSLLLQWHNLRVRRGILRLADVALSEHDEDWRRMRLSSESKVPAEPLHAVRLRVTRSRLPVRCDVHMQRLDLVVQSVSVRAGFRRR